MVRGFQVADIGADSLAALMASDSSGLLILDTRSPSEYDVSRIDGAMQVDWRLDTDQFRRRYGDMVRGKKVVLYCSIGYRSSALLQNVRECQVESGAAWGANLSGEIFSWYNAGRPVVDSVGAPTDAIHPYDRNWGRLVKPR